MATSAIATDAASDETLVKRVAGKDDRAMRALFVRHYGRVFRFLIRLVKDDALAEDLASDVFLDLWRKAATFKEQSSVSTWLLSIARNKAITALTRHSEVALNDEIAGTLVDPMADPERALHDKDCSAALGRCLAKLSPEHGEIINLVYYREKSVKEVAELIGVPEPTVKTRMFYARKRMAALMKAHGTSAPSLGMHSVAMA
jgi:RNA polymerase sigma-70 factor (ECF subfamily)